MKRVSPENFPEAIQAIFETYGLDVTRAAKTSCLEVAKATVKTLRATSPKLTRAYSRSWTYKQTVTSRLGAEYTVYSRDRYRLTHLLEKGHAKAGGGWVAARVHIEPAERAAAQAVEKDIKERIRKL